MKSMEMDLLANRFNPFDGTQLCLDEDPDLFFPDYTGERSVYLSQVAKAKEICNNCWVKEQCLQYALSDLELDGVWGGTTLHERKKLTTHQ